MLVYGASDHRGAHAGELIGVLSNHQFVLHLTDQMTVEEAIQRFALLPDDYVVRTMDGAHFSMGQLRRRLRDAARKHREHPAPVIAVSGYWPNLSPDYEGLLPLDAMDCAEATLKRLLEWSGASNAKISCGDTRMAVASEDVRTYEFPTCYRDRDNHEVTATYWVTVHREWQGWTAARISGQFGFYCWREWRVVGNHIEKISG